MYCSHCGLCCEKTEMMLSDTDVERLERIGRERQEFMRYDRYGFVRLRNRHGFCVFYDIERHRCKVYRHRPFGCRIYPIIYSRQDGIVLDDLCPMRSTVSKVELGRKGKKIMNLLQRIDGEAAYNRNKAKNLKGRK